jgi:drug/metabolite transporter (DMT)-like permease
VLRRVSPKFAGVCAVAVGLALAIASGFMIVDPPLSIPGAFILVAATLLISIGSVWLVRSSWEEPWPPDVRASEAKLLRRRRMLLIFSCALLPVALAYGIVSVINGRWWALILVLIFVANTSMNFFIYTKVRRGSSGPIATEDRQP